MFTVNWVIESQESTPVEIEKMLLNNLAFFFAACQSRIRAMRLKHAASPPDGFIVFDKTGKEVDRWFLFR
jgi:hypothetical protein